MAHDDEIRRLSNKEASEIKGGVQQVVTGYYGWGGRLFHMLGLMKGNVQYDNVTDDLSGRDLV